MGGGWGFLQGSQQTWHGAELGGSSSVTDSVGVETGGSPGSALGLLEKWKFGAKPWRLCPVAASSPGPQASVTLHGVWPQHVDGLDGGFRLGLGACL